MSQKKFCGKCGARLDEVTCLCPNCDRVPVKPEKKGGSMLALWIVLGVVLLLLAMLGGALALNYYEIISVPVLDDITDAVTGLWDRDGGRKPLPGETVTEPAEETEEIPDVQAPPETTVPPETTRETEPAIEPPPEPTELRDVPGPVADVTASSTLPDDVATHDAWNLLDDDPKTNWAENADGYGIGEYLDFEFWDSYYLVTVRIRGGNRYNEKRFYNNARPEVVTLTFSDGTSQTFRIEDGMHSQLLVLDEPVMTKTVRITIDSVYEGYYRQGVDKDTVISDVSFEAYEVVEAE